MITPKYHIEVPTDKYYSNPCVFKVTFGKKYLIWKGKSMIQSVKNMAIIIERMFRTGVVDETSPFYNALLYIKRARVLKGYVDIIEMDERKNTDWLSLLKTEQGYLDLAKNDTNNINNNFIAYVPNHLGEQIKKDFTEWYDSTHVKVKKTRSKAKNKVK